jgi:hypothetical protein
MKAIMLPVVLMGVWACGPAVPSTEQANAGRDSAADSLAARDTAAAPVELRTDRERYVPGDAVSVTLVNRTDATFAFNPCTRILERESSQGWTRIAEPQRVCTMQAYILEPRQTRTESTEIPDTVAPGRYRIVIALTREGAAPGSDAASAVSSTITVGS